MKLITLLGRLATFCAGSVTAVAVVASLLVGPQTTIATVSDVIPALGFGPVGGTQDIRMARGTLDGEEYTSKSYATARNPESIIAEFLARAEGDPLAYARRVPMANGLRAVYIDSKTRESLTAVREGNRTRVGHIVSPQTDESFIAAMATARMNMASVEPAQMLQGLRANGATDEMIEAFGSGALSFQELALLTNGEDTLDDIAHADEIRDRFLARTFPTEDRPGTDVPGVDRYPGSVRSSSASIMDDSVVATATYYTPASASAVISHFSGRLPSQGWRTKDAFAHIMQQNRLDRRSLFFERGQATLMMTFSDGSEGTHYTVALAQPPVR